VDGIISTLDSILAWRSVVAGVGELEGSINRVCVCVCGGFHVGLAFDM
jgi:hypothetical protein